MDSLPANVIDDVCSRLNIASISALGATCSNAHDPAHHKLSDLRAKWTRWLEDAELPFSGFDSRRLRCDDAVFAFVCDADAMTRVFPSSDGKERKWLHVRAHQLGISSETPRRGRAKARLVLKKPPGWRMDWSRPPTKEPVRRAKKAWSRECDQCGEELDIWGAMYHHSGMGPLCADCIEADDDLAGLKWEAKADF